MDVQKRIETYILLEKMTKNKEAAKRVGLKDNSYGQIVYSGTVKEKKGW